MYRLVISDNADRQLKSLPDQIQARMYAAFRKLEENPRMPGVRKVKGARLEGFRIRIGIFSVIISVAMRQRKYSCAKLKRDKVYKKRN